MTKLETEQQYKWALGRIEELLKVTADSPDEPNMPELELLSSLVSDYEDEHFPIAVPSLQDMLKLKMYEMELTQKELAELIGTSASRLSQYMTGKAEPTFSIARNICKKLDIPANIVLGVAI